MKKFNPNERLPDNWIIPSSGQHFYRFGFSQYRNGCTDRPKLYHPLLVALVICIIIIRFMYLLATPTKTIAFHLYIGDFGHFMGMKFHTYMVASLFFCLSKLTQFLHFYEYLCGRGQPYMKVFLMMSGQITPQSIGLTDEKIIKDILRKTRFAFKCIYFIHYSVFIMGFMISFTPLLIDSSIKTIIIAFLHSLFISLGAHYVTNIILS